MFEGKQKDAVLKAFDFARKIRKEHIGKIEESSSENDLHLLNVFRSVHSSEELEKYIFDIAIEYHNWKTPTSSDGLITKQESIEVELKSLISKIDSLNHTAPDTFDDIAQDMYSPYLRTGEFKAQTFTYHDPQIELKHLHRAVGLTKMKRQAKAKLAKLAKKRGNYWHRIENIWKQITMLPPKSSQNSSFIQFSEMVFNSGKRCKDPYESAEALSKDYRRYLITKPSAFAQPKCLDKEA